MKNNYTYKKDGTILKNGIALNAWKDRHGYSICKINGNNYRVHRLIAQWYLPFDERFCETVNHKDGNKNNNNIENLEWATFSENAKHAWKNNLCKPCRGEDHGKAKLTSKQVEWILKQDKPGKNGRGGFPSTVIAKMFNVNPVTIRRIRNGESWKHPKSNQL